MDWVYKYSHISTNLVLIIVITRKMIKSSPSILLSWLKMSPQINVIIPASIAAISTLLLLSTLYGLRNSCNRVEMINTKIEATAFMFPGNMKLTKMSTFLKLFMNSQKNNLGFSPWYRIRKYCLILFSPDLGTYLNMIISPMTGIPITQITRIGSASANIHFMCSDECQSISVLTLTLLTPSSMSIHLKNPRDCSASFGWSKNTILMNEMIKYLDILLISFFLIKYTMTQMRATIMNRIIGSNIDRNILSR